MDMTSLCFSIATCRQAKAAQKKPDIEQVPASNSCCSLERTALCDAKAHMLADASCKLGCE